MLFVCGVFSLVWLPERGQLNVTILHPHQKARQFPHFTVCFQECSIWKPAIYRFVGKQAKMELVCGWITHHIDGLNMINLCCGLRDSG